MLKKEIIAPDQAASMLKDGMTVLVGGFMVIGTPEKLVDAVVASGVKDLTIVCNDAGLPGKGVGKLIENGQVKKLIASHIGLNRTAGDKMNAGEMEIDLVPQGTLAEQIRAGGAGLGGVLTRTGVGTLVAEGKQVVTIDGEDFLLEKPIKADVALIKSSVSDVYGNTKFNKTTANFNPAMATAAELVLVQADEIVEPGVHDVNSFSVPSVLVDYLVE
ncbi:CoA transferase subunit A [Reinekea marinisedimentorum]|uniref:Acetate CoA/acetoacetate CoA-transferase alpha subunit n=1 Tax=Reinekea marinisedimentorum TaxID=230495 RepID=A0A4R3I9U6_9GAMM|nr:CoA transferase subunit A [Reinekea marinisedimentorum]TCS41085.1 acetate CoA/acetoacetate CoA-transferase alpha subunit [Reinekea marinisedimentorum]